MAIHFSNKVLAIYLIILFIFVGCSSNSPTQEVPLVVSPTPTRIIPPTSTLRPSPLPKATSAPTSTRTLMVMPSPTETGEPTQAIKLENNELEGAEFYNYGFLENWRFFVSIRTLKPVVGQYYAKIGEKYRLKEYKCEVFPANLNRLVCSGELTRIDDWVEYAIYPIGSVQPAFQGRVSVPLPYDVYPISNPE